MDSQHSLNAAPNFNAVDPYPEITAAQERQRIMYGGDVNATDEEVQQGISDYLDALWRISYSMPQTAAKEEVMQAQTEAQRKVMAGEISELPKPDEEPHLLPFGQAVPKVQAFITQFREATSARRSRERIYALYNMSPEALSQALGVEPENLDQKLGLRHY